ncbi:MAG: hypothetical protein VYE27_00655 [Pseudomonadota bacterium]|nr:hypothetical protein [Pseudomonadota bacterium]
MIEASLTSERVLCRDPDEVMKLERLGSFHQTRLSFMRQLLRRLSAEKWTFCRPIWEMSADGYGTAVYTVKGPEREYSLVGFSNRLRDADRSDRVIATAWDLTFVLYDGIPKASDISRLKKNVPRQEAGRYSEKELVLGRANKSVRLWNKVLELLRNGQQPSVSEIEDVGYLMRTTAVYGSGKFGLCDREFTKDRVELRSPFQAEMLAVYLVRCLVCDLIEYIAVKSSNGVACKIKPELRKYFGIGNSTGLGMAPFLVTHPSLFHRWIKARETAIGRIRSIENYKLDDGILFRRLLESTITSVSCWKSVHVIQTNKLKDLRRDLKKIKSFFNKLSTDQKYPWDTLFLWAMDKLTVEGQEALFSLMLEPFPHLVDELASEMSVEENNYFRIDGSIECRRVSKIIEKDYAWALKCDYSKAEDQARFWYISEEKLEPRLGERFKEDGADLEQPLAIGRDIVQLYETLNALPDNLKLADLLMKHPDLRHTIRRILQNGGQKYAEIRENIISSKMKPIDMLRCKLSFFGATRFDPRSDRWVRICMYQNAPFPKELIEKYDDYWPYPILKGTG